MGLVRKKAGHAWLLCSYWILGRKRWKGRWALLQLFFSSLIPRGGKVFSGRGELKRSYREVGGNNWRVISALHKDIGNYYLTNFCLNGGGGQMRQATLRCWQVGTCHMPMVGAPVTQGGWARDDRAQVPSGTFSTLEIMDLEWMACGIWPIQIIFSQNP